MIEELKLIHMEMELQEPQVKTSSEINHLSQHTIIVTWIVNSFHTIDINSNMLILI
jgi:hypothetical protein